MRKINRFIRALWWFRKELWNWSDVDWSPQYDLLMRGLEGVANHIEDHDFYEGCKQDVDDIQFTLEMYRAYQEDELQHQWTVLHEMLHEYGRKWWC